MTDLSPNALAALRLLVQHGAEEMYPDVYEKRIDGAMLNGFTRHASLRQGFLELWHVAGFEGSPTSSSWPPEVR